MNGVHVTNAHGRSLSWHSRRVVTKPGMSTDGIEFKIDGDEVSAEFTLVLAPGTLAADRDRKIFELLSSVLSDLATKMGAVLAADAPRFVRQEPGKLADGSLRFTLKARKEGDRLLPALKSKRYRSSNP